MVSLFDIPMDTLFASDTISVLNAISNLLGRTPRDTVKFDSMLVLKASNSLANESTFNLRKLLRVAIKSRACTNMLTMMKKEEEALSSNRTPAETVAADQTETPEEKRKKGRPIAIKSRAAMNQKELMDKAETPEEKEAEMLLTLKLGEKAAEMMKEEWKEAKKAAEIQKLEEKAAKTKARQRKRSRKAHLRLLAKVKRAKRAEREGEEGGGEGEES